MANEILKQMIENFNEIKINETFTVEQLMSQFSLSTKEMWDFYLEFIKIAEGAIEAEKDFGGYVGLPYVIPYIKKSNISL